MEQTRLRVGDGPSHHARLSPMRTYVTLIDTCFNLYAQGGHVSLCTRNVGKWDLYRFPHGVDFNVYKLQVICCDIIEGEHIVLLDHRFTYVIKRCELDFPLI